jgi:hypothetical protein
MQEEEITNYIVKELEEFHNPKDIILAVCEKTNMPWAEAQALVRQVQLSAHQKISGRQSPKLIGLSIATFILGLGFLVAGFIPVHQGMITKYYPFFSCIGAAMCIGGIRGMWDLITEYFKGK